MSRLFELKDEHGLEEVGRYILMRYPDCRILKLYGDLGAGKTTFTKYFARLVGVKDDVSSPTYSIVNEYICIDNTILYHIDLYRLEDEAQCLEIGIMDIMQSGNYCVIEWPDVFEEMILEEGSINLYFRDKDDGERVIEIR